MLKAYQLFAAISSDLATQIFRDLREHHRDLYRGVLVSLAKERRLRPVFIQRKSANDQINWMIKTCKLKPSDGMAEHVFQVWLLHLHKDVLKQFLAGMGIEHDDDGTVDDLPDELDADKLSATVEELLKGQSGEMIGLYLRIFQLQKPEGWPALNELLEKDQRLQLGDAVEDEAPVSEDEPSDGPTPEEPSEGASSPVQAQDAETELEPERA